MQAHRSYNLAKCEKELYVYALSWLGPVSFLHGHGVAVRRRRSAMRAPIGKTLGGFEIVRELGRGSMGVVFDGLLAQRCADYHLMPHEHSRGFSCRIATDWALS